MPKETIINYHYSQIRFNNQYPNGWTHIPNNVPQSQCGLRAVIHSLRSQLGPNPTNALGVVVQIPSYQNLYTLYQQIRATGVFTPGGIADTEGPNEGPQAADRVARTLRDWGGLQQLDITLGILRPNTAPFELPPPPTANTRTIWIYNSGNHWVGVQ